MEYCYLYSSYFEKLRTVGNGDVNIKVLLVEDHKIVREGIRFFLENQPDIDVVAEADNGETALQLSSELHPDVALMDLNMPVLNGIDTTRRISSEYPETRVLILSMHSEKQYLMEALRAGAKGFILKSSISAKELVQAIRKVAAGENYFSPFVLESILADYIKLNTEEPPSCFSLISPREREILQLIAEGKNTKEIAFSLKVSPKTIDSHRQNIMKKLKLCSIAELTKFAIRQGLATFE
jgi:DNA-binding NarL/FixJ family response regulator